MNQSLSLIHNTIVGPADSVSATQAIYMWTGTVFITNTIVASHTVGIYNDFFGMVTAWNTLFDKVNTPTSGGVTNNSPVSGNAAFVNPAAETITSPPKASPSMLGQRLTLISHLTLKAMCDQVVWATISVMTNMTSLFCMR